MKIRVGFVTNSSSTNFLIISKEELTEDYLCEKLGICDGSPLKEICRQLCDDILYGTTRGLRWYNFEHIDENAIREAFGDYSAKKYLKLSKRGYFTYWGHIGTDSNFLTSYIATDSFLIDEKDFYFDGKNGTW